MPFRLPPLPFDRAALAPHMSAETIDFHHGKHHQAYVDKTNALANEAGLARKSLVELIRATEPGPLQSNAGQLWNHSFFWQCLTPKATRPSAELAALIERSFGSIETLITEFSEEANAHFGSGWAWLVLDNGALRIVGLHDGDTPVSHEGMAPLLTLDVWEHAYYIDYRNARPQYAEAVLKNLVNWDFASSNLDGSGCSRADQVPTAVALEVSG